MKSFQCVVLALSCLVAASIDAEEAQTKPAEESTEAAEVAKEAEDAPMSQEEVMAKWLELASPGPHHERFERQAGRWLTSMRVWMDPSAPAQTSSGECMNEIILGGRFMQTRCTGTMMDMEFEGVGIEGYDKFRKQYTSIWVDNMGTMISIMTGTCDDKGRRCTYFGRMDDPMTGTVGQVHKSTLSWINPKKAVFELFTPMPGGDWFRMLEISYTRPPKE